jgi:hypothetical protein
MSETFDRTRRKDPAMANLGYERDPSEFYPTPAWCTEALLRNYNFPTYGVIWEPACGQGHISLVLEAHGYDVFSTDLNETGFGHSGRDFLKEDTPAKVIITNPPYKNNLAEKFVRHALRLTEERQGIVAMLMRTDWSSAKGRVDIVRHPSFALKLELNRRPMWVKDTTGSPRFNYSWFLFDWNTIDHPPTIKFDQ